ncbi:related to NOP6 - protein with possible role in rRNA processing [Ustilago sp. UG-2017a]|nr:related to NOP6 - protein with possible role in rRNA processing [Ustilago sp. UG-2017a]
MAEAKLTKKQQKNVAFRAKKGKATALAHHPATPDDVVDAEDAPSTSTVEMTKASTSSKKAAKAEKPTKTKKVSKMEGDAVADDAAAGEAPAKEEKRSHKRKRLAAEAAAGITSQPGPSTSSQPQESSKPKPTTKPKKTTLEAPAKKTTFGEDGEVAAEQTVKPTIPTTIESSAKGNKYILFIGNMAFTTTTDTISKHFGQTCGEVPYVRLLTKKADPNALANLPASKRKSIAKGKAQDPTKAQSKGCAFVEFKSSEALRKALKFHHTMLEGRNINVELTAGGGGKSESRQEKIKAKNAGLEKERQKLHGKYVAPKNEARKQARGAKGAKGGQEGEGEGRERKRQRRDGNAEEGGSGWGKNSRKERKMPRFMATGSNAVRVAPTS